ncbi:hypothetical protein AMK27_38815 [Streptomyces sp. CB02009]|uniref:hypothetical protein n=1 Tax=Streptomyces sp. CB02009 TaxID=1703938 RepID=UPI0009393488|nr:hypothetical protein [Streptomyces sp. CB02009]OKJ48096.1 hypothetical protein AMK27_38815 [Streptomyces sp. CB02009]
MSEDLVSRAIVMPDGARVIVVVKPALAALSDAELLLKLPFIETINERWAEQEAEEERKREQGASSDWAVPDELRDEMERAKAKGLQSDLRVLAQRLQAAAPEGTRDFDEGIAWAVRWLENTATGLTR